MGNRPQGSNKFYMTMVYFWVGIMVYLVFASIFITVKSIQAETADHHFAFSDIFHNQIFFTLIISLASTYVLWFVISFLFFDPWHLFTSVSASPLFHPFQPKSIPSSSNISSLRRPTSIFSTSTLSATPTTSLGAPKVTTRPPNLKASHSNQAAKSMSTFPKMTGTSMRNTMRKCPRLLQKPPKRSKI